MSYKFGYGTSYEKSENSVGVFRLGFSLPDGYVPMTITIDSAVDPSYFSASDGSINVTVTDGIGPYTYAWSNSAITEDISGLADGTYTLTVTDSLNQTKSTSITLTEPAYVPMTITLDSANDPSGSGASDGSINVTVTDGVAPYNYNWSNGATTEDISGLADGTYTLTVTDNTGAQETLEATIEYTGPTVQGLTLSTQSGTSNLSYAPAYGLYDYGMSIFLINASEFGGGEKLLTSIAYEASNYSNYTYNNQRILLAHTTATDLTTSIQITDGGNLSTPATFTGVNYSDLTEVKSPFSWLVNSGWNTVDFDTNFTYDGTSNILVIHENRDGSWVSGYGWWESWSNNGNTETWYKYVDNNFPTGYGTTNVSLRPNMRFGY